LNSLSFFIIFVSRTIKQKKMTENKYLAVAYKLCAIEDDRLIFVEEATKEHPFTFITGFGFAINAFEENLIGLAAGDKFDFTLNPDQAYGEFSEGNVVELDREIFVVDGKFDARNIYEDAVIPLQNEEGQQFLGRIDEIGEEKVRVDLNHPLAGKKLNFVGTVLENRDATSQEIEQMIKGMAAGCCGGCGHCGKEDGEGCGHHGKENGEGCCHHSKEDGEGCCHHGKEDGEHCDHHGKGKHDGHGPHGKGNGEGRCHHGKEDGEGCCHEHGKKHEGDEK